jgi:His/Glu/Gln/Arg/opine family amino acid ABC transporter permease subunit
MEVAQKERGRLEEFREWLAGAFEVRGAWLIFAAGAVGIVLVLVGSLIVITIHGWVPFENIVAAIESSEMLAVTTTGAVLGALAIIVGFATYRRMPTKRSREQAISGAILGIQAVVLWLLGLGFRFLGDPTLFVKNFLDFDVLAGSFGVFANAAKNTLILALVGEAGGIVLGMTLALLALSKRRVVRAPARAYINFFRGTPLIWQISFFYFGFTIGLRLELGIDLGPIHLSEAYVAAMLIFILNTAAYAAEVFRAGIQSIERGQMEAARSLGMSDLQAMRYAIVPQAFRRVIPPLLNEFVILIKDTSLVVVLGLLATEYELYTQAREGYADTFNATFFIAAAAGYLVVTLPLIRAVNWLERRLRSGLVGVAA